MWLVFALLSALCFGLRGILYHWTSQKSVNRNLMLAGMFFTGMVASLCLTLILDQAWSAGMMLGIVMGMMSFCANASLYKGYTVGKTSLVAILSALPPLVVVILAALLWGETLSFMQLFAFAIIASGIVLIRYSSDLSLKNLQGAQWGLLAMLFFGLNDIASKQAMRLHADVFPTMFFMFLTGCLFFSGWWLKERKKSSNDWSHSRTVMWGMAVRMINICAVGLSLTALKTGITGLVSAVLSLNVLFIIFYSRIFTKEKFTVPGLIGIIVSVTGILVLSLFNSPS